MYSDLPLLVHVTAGQLYFQYTRLDAVGAQDSLRLLILILCLLTLLHFLLIPLASFMMCNFRGLLINDDSRSHNGFGGVTSLS